MVRAGPGPTRPRGQRSPQAAGRRTMSCVRRARHVAGAAADAHALTDRLDGAAGTGRAPQHGNSMIASRPPAGRFRRVTSPPCARAIVRAIERPRPTPPVSRIARRFEPLVRQEHSIVLGLRDSGAVVVDADPDRGMRSTRSTRATRPYLIALSIRLPRQRRIASGRHGYGTRGPESLANSNDTPGLSSQISSTSDTRSTLISGSLLRFFARERQRRVDHCFHVVEVGECLATLVRRPRSSSARSRSRVIGVRRSCEIAAVICTRSCTNVCRRACMRLNACAAWRNSRAPLSGSGGALTLLPSRVGRVRPA